MSPESNALQNPVEKAVGDYLASQYASDLEAERIREVRNGERERRIGELEASISKLQEELTQLRRQTSIEPDTDGTQRIRAIKEMAQSVQDTIVRSRAGAIHHYDLGLLVDTLKGEIRFGGWVYEREIILGQGPCEEIGKLVCEAMGFTVEEGEDILSRLPSPDHKDYPIEMERSVH